MPYRIYMLIYTDRLCPCFILLLDTRSLHRAPESTLGGWLLMLATGRHATHIWPMASLSPQYTPKYNATIWGKRLYISQRGTFLNAEWNLAGYIERSLSFRGINKHILETKSSAFSESACWIGLYSPALCFWSRRLWNSLAKFWVLSCVLCDKITVLYTGHVAWHGLFLPWTAPWGSMKCYSGLHL